MLTEVVAGISVFIVVLATQPAFAGETITGRVVGVSDGDTITVLDSTKTRHKIRLAGIDAPESKQAFGQASKKSLAAMVFDRDVTLDCSKTDRSPAPSLRCHDRWQGRERCPDRCRDGVVVPEVPEGADGSAAGGLCGGGRGG